MPIFIHQQEKIQSNQKKEVFFLTLPRISSLKERKSFLQKKNGLALIQRKTPRKNIFSVIFVDVREFSSPRCIMTKVSDFSLRSQTRK